MPNSKNNGFIPASEKGWITPQLDAKTRALLRCNACNKDFRELEPHVFVPECKCYEKDIRISVG